MDAAIQSHLLRRLPPILRTTTSRTTRQSRTTRMRSAAWRLPNEPNLLNRAAPSPMQTMKTTVRKLRRSLRRRLEPRQLLVGSLLRSGQDLRLVRGRMQRRTRLTGCRSQRLQRTKGTLWRSNSQDGRWMFYMGVEKCESTLKE